MAEPFAPSDASTLPTKPVPLGEIARLFLKLGVIGFGGPAAHLAMMEDEVVTRRRWMDRQAFLDLVGATHLIPGPNSTEMAIHLGLRHGGLRGMMLAGGLFILPAAVMVTLLAWLYMNYGPGHLAMAVPIFSAIKAAVMALIFLAVIRLGRTAITDHRTAVLGAGVLGVSLGGLGEIQTLLGGALLGMAWLRMARAHEAGTRLPLLLTASGVATGGLGLAGWAPRSVLGASIGPASTAPLLASASAVPALLPLAWWQVGAYFLKIGSVIYGGGYVLVAFLQGDMVEKYHWITQAQLTDAIAIGQLTPGPVFTTASFLGYLLTTDPTQPANLWPGLAGAAAGTVGIFLPSFLLVLLLSRFIPHLRKWTWTAAFLDAVNVAAVGLMAAVWVKLAPGILVQMQGQSWSLIVPNAIIFVVAAGLLARWNISALWIVLGSGVAGMMLAWTGYGG